MQGDDNRVKVNASNNCTVLFMPCTCLPTCRESGASLSVDAPVSVSMTVLREITIARNFLLSPITMQFEIASISPCQYQVRILDLRFNLDNIINV